MLNFVYEKCEEGYTYNSLFYQDVVSLINNGILGFCGCGIPEENIEYIKNGLKLIAKYADPSINYEEYQRLAKELFGNQQSEYFFYYWADSQGFTEHGSQVPGWLTSKGDELIDLMEKLC